LILKTSSGNLLALMDSAIIQQNGIFIRKKRTINSLC
jgi:hypothetical protein